VSRLLRKATGANDQARYIVTNSMWDELYNWLIANAYKAYPLKDGNTVFIRA